MDKRKTIFTCIILIGTFYFNDGGIFLLLFRIILVFCLFLIYFARDPDRAIPKIQNAVLAPADGKILEVVKEKEDPKQLKISIFLSLFDVHVIRAPIPGKVTMFTHNKGKYLAAFTDKASSQNANITLKLSSDLIDLDLRMISGNVARKIICYLKPDDSVQAGERVGRIILGSRTEISVPSNKVDKVMVNPGDKVKAGETVLTHLKINHP